MVTTTTELIDTGEKRDRLGRRVTPARRRAELVREYQATRASERRFHVLLSLGEFLVWRGFRVRSTTTYRQYGVAKLTGQGLTRLGKRNAIDAY